MTKKTWLILVVAALLVFAAACTKAEQEEEAPPANEAAAAEESVQEEVIYTAENPGPWSGKDDAHVPEIAYEKSEAGLLVTGSEELFEKSFEVDKARAGTDPLQLPIPIELQEHVKSIGIPRSRRFGGGDRKGGGG